MSAGPLARTRTVQQPLQHALLHNPAALYQLRIPLLGTFKMIPPQAGGGFYLKIKTVNSSRLQDRFKSPLERVSRRGGDVRACAPVHRDFGEVGHATCETVDGLEVYISIPEAGGTLSSHKSA